METKHLYLYILVFSATTEGCNRIQCENREFNKICRIDLKISDYICVWYNFIALNVYINLCESTVARYQCWRLSFVNGQYVLLGNVFSVNRRYSLLSKYGFFVCLIKCYRNITKKKPTSNKCQKIQTLKWKFRGIKKV